MGQKLHMRWVDNPRTERLEFVCPPGFKKDLKKYIAKRKGKDDPFISMADVIIQEISNFLATEGIGR